MKLPKTSVLNSSQGFTLLEVAIAIGLLTMIMGIGLALSMDVWRGTSFHSEKDLVVSLLYKARSRAVANMGEVNHGLYIDEDNRQYVIFRDTYDEDSDENIAFDMSPTIDFDDGEDTEVVFVARTGSALDSSGYLVRMIGEGREDSVVINGEGGVTW